MSLLDLAKQAAESTLAQRKAEAKAEAQRKEDARVNECLQRCLKDAGEGFRSVKFSGREGEPWVTRIQSMGVTTSFTSHYNEPGHDSDLGDYGGDTDYYVTLSGWESPNPQATGMLKSLCETYSDGMAIIRQAVTENTFKKAQEAVLAAAAKGETTVWLRLAEKDYARCLSPANEVLVQMLQSEGLQVEAHQSQTSGITIKGW